jgi:predicted nucleic acid-binding Zn ribbon protein
MRRTNTQPLREVLQEYIRVLKLQGKLDEVKLRDYWNELLGRSIALVTKDVRLHNNVLFVYLNSSVVRNELLMMRTSLMKALNDKLGKEVILDIVFR